MYDATDQRMRSKSFQNVTIPEKVACADLSCVNLKSQSLAAQDGLPDVVCDPEAEDEPGKYRVQLRPLRGSHYEPQGK
jgi:hypothetical protein